MPADMGDTIPMNEAPRMTEILRRSDNTQYGMSSLALGTSFSGSSGCFWGWISGDLEVEVEL
jgi:hypothetical protein